MIKVGLFDIGGVFKIEVTFVKIKIELLKIPREHFQDMGAIFSRSR